MFYQTNQGAINRAPTVGEMIRGFKARCSCLINKKIHGTTANIEQLLLSMTSKLRYNILHENPADNPSREIYSCLTGSALPESGNEQNRRNPERHPGVHRQ
jgi:hypothetical protein